MRRASEVTEPEVRLVLPASAGSVTIVRQALSGLADALDWGDDFLTDVKLAISEACSNVVVHAYDDNETGTIEVLAWVAPGKLRVAIRDTGKGLTPIVGDRGAAGLGIGMPIMIALSDSVRISSREWERTSVELDFTVPGGSARNGG